MICSGRSVRPVAALALVTLLGACGSSGSQASTTSSPGPSAPGSSAQQAAATPATGAARSLDVAAFEALVASGAGVLLDVRTPQEYASGHLKGAKLVDASAPDFDTRIAALDKTASYALYCHSGNRSARAMQRMAAAGFSRVVDLDGGIAAWVASGRPVTAS
jgi:phage shock protein E